MPQTFEQHSRLMAQPLFRLSILVPHHINMSRQTLTTPTPAPSTNVFYHCQNQKHYHVITLKYIVKGMSAILSKLLAHISQSSLNPFVNYNAYLLKISTNMVMYAHFNWDGLSPN